MNTSFFKRTLVTLSAAVAALTLNVATAQAAPAPSPIRDLDRATDNLLSAVKSERKDMNRRERDRFENTVRTAQNLETAVDNLRSAVENRKPYGYVAALLNQVNGEYRSLAHRLDDRRVGRSVRSNLSNTGASLRRANAVLGSGMAYRGGRYDDRQDYRSDHRSDHRDDYRGSRRNAWR